MNLKKITLIAFSMATLLSSTLEGKAQDSYADIYKTITLSRGFGDARQMKDAAYFTSLQSGEILKCSYLDSEYKEVLYAAPMGDFAIRDYTLSPNESMILISQGAAPIYRRSFTTHYHLVKNGRPSAILHDVEATRNCTFSPNSKKLAYSSLNNLYIYDIESEKSTPITADGEWNKIINGTTDWVYEEELAFTKAYWFSPDSKEIAYLKFDESDVPLFEMMRYDNKLYNKAFSFKYPKAGDKNSVVELWVYDIESGENRKINTGSETDQYIPHVGYTPDGKLYFYRLNRLQNHLEVVLVDRKDKQKTIYEERSEKYIDRVSGETITFIDKNKFIVCEETTAGFKHLYLHSISKGRVGAITSGNWEVTSLLNATKDRVYYSSTERSPLCRDIYSIDIDGKNKQILTDKKGTYYVRHSHSMDYFIASYSSLSTPAQTAVYNKNGKVVRMLEDNHLLAQKVEEDNRPQKEFITIPTERGDTLNGYIIKPKDFDSSKKYPLLLTQYCGPGSQQVADNWSLSWEDALVSHGYIVICADTRGTGFRGEKFKKMTYCNLGALEVEDQISVAKYGAALPYIDSERVGIYGWSYGGFMSLNCALKSNGLFKMAIAVAPVTSWRYYDTIYTEVYNGIPSQNPKGYDDNSPINFADGLADRTSLLIVHGTADDNVHFQNSVEMCRALNKAGKEYDMMVYPDQNHSMAPNDKVHVREKLLKYTLKNL